MAAKTRKHPQKGRTEVVYYLLGNRPVKVFFVDDFAELVQTPDRDFKRFTFDHRYLKIINDAPDATKVNAKNFAIACHAIGLNPP